MPNISAGSSKVSKTGFTTNQYAKRKASANPYSPDYIVGEEDLVLWYDFNDTSTMTKADSATSEWFGIKKILNKSTSTKKLGEFARTYSTSYVYNKFPMYARWEQSSDGCIKREGRGISFVGTTQGLEMSNNPDERTYGWAPLVSSAAAGFGGVQDGVKWSNLTGSTDRGMTIITVHMRNRAGVTATASNDRKLYTLNRKNTADSAINKFQLSTQPKPANPALGWLGGTTPGTGYKIKNFHNNDTINPENIDVEQNNITWTAVIEGADKTKLWKYGMPGYGDEICNTSNLNYSYEDGYLVIGATCVDNTCSNGSGGDMPNNPESPNHTFYEMIIVDREISQSELDNFNTYFKEKYIWTPDNTYVKHPLEAGQAAGTGLPFGVRPITYQAHGRWSPHYYNTPNMFNNCWMWYDFTDLEMMWKSAEDTTCAPGVGQGPETCTGHVTHGYHGGGIGRVYNKAANGQTDPIKHPSFYRRNANYPNPIAAYSGYPGDGEINSIYNGKWIMGTFVRAEKDDANYRPILNSNKQIINNPYFDCVSCEEELPSITTGGAIGRGAMVSGYFTNLPTATSMQVSSAKTTNWGYYYHQYNARGISWAGLSAQVDRNILAQHLSIALVVKNITNPTSYIEDAIIFHWDGPDSVGDQTDPTGTTNLYILIEKNTGKLVVKYINQPLAGGTPSTFEIKSAGVFGQERSVEPYYNFIVLDAQAGTNNTTLSVNGVEVARVTLPSLPYRWNNCFFHHFNHNVNNQFRYSFGAPIIQTNATTGNLVASTNPFNGKIFEFMMFNNINHNSTYFHMSEFQHKWLYKYFNEKYKQRWRAPIHPLQEDLVGWWDFNDTTTLFQDIAGTSAVTTAGQRIGRVNNKAQGDANGDKMGSFLIAHTDNHRPTWRKSTDPTVPDLHYPFKEDLGYMDCNGTFPAGDRGLRGGFYTTANPSISGGVSATKYSDLVLNIKSMTVFAVVHHHENVIECNFRNILWVQGEDGSGDVARYSLRKHSAGNATCTPKQPGDPIYEANYLQGGWYSTNATSNMQNKLTAGETEESLGQDNATYYKGQGVLVMHNSCTSSMHLEVNHCLGNFTEDGVNKNILDADCEAKDLAHTDTPIAGDCTLSLAANTYVTSDGAPSVVLGAITVNNNGITANSWGNDSNKISNNIKDNGRIYEVLVYNKVMSEAEITTVKAYLAQKYGMKHLGYGTGTLDF